jgi:hypothetical protein
MKTKWRVPVGAATAAALAAVVVWSCGNDRLVDIKLNDTISPAAITDLVADSATSGSITLHWTAPGDNGDKGTAAAYDIRYHKSKITSANWDSATQCDGEPTPKPAGSPESYVVTGLDELTEYFFAIKAIDDAANKSTLSEVVSDTTLEKYYVTWARTFGGWNEEFATDVAVAPDGGYVITGETNTFDNGFGDIYLVKVDENGNSEWAKIYGYELTEDARTIAVTPDGGYIMAGECGLYDEFDDTLDAYFVKVNGSGNLQWESRYRGQGHTLGRAAVVAHDGGYMAIGDTYEVFGNPPSNGFGFILKLAESGEILWVDSLTFDRSLSPVSIAAIPGGGYVIAGMGGGGDIPYFTFLMKIDNSANLLWMRSFYEGHTDIPFSLICASDGGYVTACWASNDMTLLKVDATGQKLWDATLGGGEQDNAMATAEAGDGNYVVAGTSESFGNGESFDLYLAKVDNSGQLIWERTYGGDQADGAVSISVAPDGGFIVGALTKSFGAGLSDYWLLKLDPQGRLNE